MYVVLTADQRDSRRRPDLVPDTLDALNTATPPAPFRAFERTAGDEIQGVLRDPSSTLDRVAWLLRSGQWSIGLGIGDVEAPLPASTRAGRGAAFNLARTAVERAKRNPGRVAVLGEGTRARTANHLETVLMLWAGVLDRRTAKGWEVADLLADGSTHAAAASRLGISQPAVSQRARTAGVEEAERTRRLAEDLLADLLADPLAG